MTYLWEVVSGPVAVTLSSTTVSNPTFTAPTTLGDYTFKLTVGDGRTNALLPNDREAFPDREESRPRGCTQLVFLSKYGHDFPYYLLRK